MTPEQLHKAYTLLKDAGYSFPSSCPDGFLCIIDPTCVWPFLIEFINTAWIILSIMTAFLLAGWGITMVRGASHDVVKNLRTLVLIFGTLSAAVPVVNVLGAGKYFVGKCEVIQIRQSEIQELMDENKPISPVQYEDIEIRDSDVDDMSEFDF